MIQNGPEVGETARWFNRLSLRVAVFLSLALLPLGLLAVLQTRDLTREVRTRSELSLLALTERSASTARQKLERALGAAEALSAVLRLIRNDPVACSAYLKDYLQGTRRYSYVGFVPLDGVVRCASNRQFVDFSNEPLFSSLLENPRQTVEPLTENDMSERSSVVVYIPVFDQGKLLGFTVISVLRTEFKSDAVADAKQRPVGLATFNAEGRILTAEAPSGAQLLELPENVEVSRLAGQSSGTFFDTNRAGIKRLFVYTEIVPGIAYAIATWNVAEQPFVGTGFQVPASLFPLLMWLASLAVAVFAMHRLVVRHLQTLSKEMRRFAIDRQLPKQQSEKSRPFEVRELEQSFTSMAHALLNDEARMEDALREKNVLLKEVHHRVRNNLQMMSSIMNMKARNARSPETKAVVRTLQDRILGLAAVHQTADLSKTNAGALLREIFNQILFTGAAVPKNVKLSMCLEDIIMLPDQAVPLSLLASEITSNALDTLAAPDGADPWIALSLEMTGPGMARLQLRNSISAVNAADADQLERGLDARLIQALIGQLEATHQDEQTETELIVTVTFPVQDVAFETRDY